MNTPSLSGKSHAANLINGSLQQPPRSDQERAAALNAGRIPNLRANAQTVVNDLPDPAAVGYLLLLFDQCRLYELTHAQLVEVFGRPLLAFLDLSLQAVEKLAQRSGIGSGMGSAAGTPPPAPEAEDAEPHRPWLTPYQAARLRDIAGDYAAALPDPRAVDALLLVYDLLEVFELSPGQCETVLGAETLRTLTEVVYGQRVADKQPAEREAGEVIQYDLPAQDVCPSSSVHISGRPIPVFGTVGENGHITYTPEARLWLRYIGRPDDPISSTNGGAA